MKLSRMMTATVIGVTALALCSPNAVAQETPASTITVGAAGSAKHENPTENGKWCGTAYVGKDDGSLHGENPPQDAKAIAGLPVLLLSTSDEEVSRVVTNASGGYCFSPEVEGFDHVSIDTSAIDTHNSAPGIAKLTLTHSDPDDYVAALDANDQQVIGKFIYIQVTVEPYVVAFHNLNFAFDETPPPPKPVGSVETYMLQFFNLPEILRGMLHGGAGSTGS